MTAVQYIGSKISLISKSDIRYEGILYTIDPVECTIALAKVKSMGTEDRPTDRPVPARSEVYEYIVFRGSDIRDIRVCQPPKPQPVLAGGLPNDPAILQHSLPGGSTSTQSGESTSSAPETGLGSFMSGISKTKSDAAIGQPVPSLLPLCTASVAASNASTERATQVDHNRNATTSSTRGRGSQPVTPPRGTRRFEGQQNRQLSGQRDYNYIPTHPGGFQQNRPYFYRDQQRGYNDNYHFDRRAQYDLTSEGYVDRRFNNNAGFRGNRGGLMNRSRDFQDRRVQNGYMGRPNYYYNNNNDYYGNNYGYRYNDQSRQYGQNYQGYNPNYSGRGGGQYQQRESRQTNHDSESSGGRRITFNEDYDFETANNEFENLKEKFSELKIDNTEVEAAAAAGEATSCTTPAAGDKTEEKKDCEENEEKEKKEEQEEKSDDGNVASNLNTSATKDTPNTKKCYDPTVSFFDNLSNIPPKASNMDRGKEIKRNLETFGERGRMRARRAAMNNFAQQPRVANYGGFRGEFLYANNFRPFNNAFYNNRTRGYPNRLGNGGGGQMDYRSRFQTLPVGGLYRRNRRF